MLRMAVAALVLTVPIVAAAAPETKFTSTWKSPDAAGTRFAGKKVAAVVISADDGLRVSVEEALARALTPRDVVPVPAYRIVPREELRDADKAKPWFERAGVEGVVALRVISAGKKRTYVPGPWTAPYYSSFWSYYGYGWGSVGGVGTVQEDTVVVIETLVFSISRDALLWAGVSETTNPKNTASLLEGLVESVVKQMREQGLIAR
jgi:hypothetical protein